MYRYFISFAGVDDNTSGFGNTQIESENRLEHIDLIHELERKIRKEGKYFDVVILGVTLLHAQ